MASRTRRAAAAAALLTLAIGAGACGDDDGEDEGGAAATPAAEVQKLAISSTEKGKQVAWTAPATLESGIYEITLTNKGKKPHAAGLVRIDGDHTPEEALKVIGQEEGVIPGWLHGAGGTSGVRPGATGTVTQKLDPGSYMLQDDEQDDQTVASTKMIEVTGEPVTAELPSAPAQVVMDEYSFRTTGLKAGRNTILMDNAGKELHHTLAFPIAKGKTFADVKKFATTEGEGEGPPPVDFEAGEGTAVLDGGFQQIVDFDLKPGRYALICFLPDRAGGPPHVAKGMLSELTVK